MHDNPCSPKHSLISHSRDTRRGVGCHLQVTRAPTRLFIRDPRDLESLERPEVRESPRRSTSNDMDLIGVHPADLLDRSTVALFAVLASCILLSAVAGWTTKRRQRQRRSEPASSSDRPVGMKLPGPRSLPILGSYPFMDLPYRRWLPEGTRKYGEIFAFQLAGKCWVSLNSFKAIEALKEHGEALSSRPQGLWSKKLFNGNGLALGEGHAWGMHRKFVIRFVAKIRSQQVNLESMMHEELQVSLNELVPNEPVSSELFTSITANIVFRIIFGQRASDNKNFTSKFEAVQTIVQKDIYSTFVTAVLLPYLLAFPNLLFYLVKKTRTAQQSIKLLLSFIENQIRQASQLRGCGCDPTFFVEAAINNSTLTGLDNYSDSSLAVTIFDLLIGATDTTSSCLKWIFLYLATYKNGDYQDELADELAALTGSRAVTAADCKESSGLRALVTEVLRLHPPLPTAINHRAKEDIVVLGYSVPAGAWVFPNLREALRSSEIFGESPNKFNPARFLTQPGGRFAKPSEIIPFSLGSRSCPGKQLAEFQIPLVTAELIRQFRFKLAGDAAEEAVSRLMRGSDGLVWSPKEYKLVLEPRAS